MEWYVDLNDLDSFVYNGKSSVQMKFLHEADNLSPFERDIEFVEIDGSEDRGDLLVDYKRLKNKKIPVEGHIDCSMSDAKLVAKEIEEWLVSDVRYKPLIFSNDLTEYEAVVTDLDIKEVVTGLLKVKFTFNSRRRR